MIWGVSLSVILPLSAVHDDFDPVGSLRGDGHFHFVGYGRTGIRYANFRRSLLLDLYVFIAPLEMSHLLDGWV